MYPPPHFRASHHLLALSLHLRCLHACLLPPISLPVALDPLSRYPRSTLHVTRLLFTPLTCSRPVPAAPLPVPQVLERIKQGYQYLLPSICVEIFSKEGAAAGEKPYGVVRQRAAGGGGVNILLRTWHLLFLSGMGALCTCTRTYTSSMLALVGLGLPQQRHAL